MEMREPMRSDDARVALGRAGEALKHLTGHAWFWEER
jgi:hypothetical protein